MNYDIGIIGAGISGVFAALRLAEKHKNLKVVIFEFGPPPPTCLRQDPIRIKRRRRQLEGWFGCFPTGDGKVYYEEDFAKVLAITDGRRFTTIKDWVCEQFSDSGDLKCCKNKVPNTDVKKAIINSGLNLTVHSYTQWNIDQIHQLAKIAVDKIENCENIYLSFDTEVIDFNKSGKKFIVNTSQGEFNCKKIIMGAGRSGWRWSHEIFNKLGILQDSHIAKYGFKIEMPASSLKSFNKSHCTISGEGIDIGPLQWSGSVIQEDHEDMTIAAFKSAEETDKVFFSIHKEVKCDDSCKYVDRIAKLSHLLSGDRVGREKIKSFIKRTNDVIAKKDNFNKGNGGVGDLAAMPEYSWLEKTLTELNDIFPNIISRGYLHIPDISTNVNNIKISNTLETEIDGLLVSGECTGIKGIAAAAILGAIAAEGAAK